MSHNPSILARRPRPRAGGGLISRLWSRSGSAAVSLGLLAPVLILVLGGVVDYGRILYNNMSLTDAARAGVQYLWRVPNDTAGTVEAVSTASTLDMANSTITVSQFCECLDRTIVSCTGSCSDGGPYRFLRVSVTHPFSPFIGAMAELAPSVTRAQATMRVE